MPDSSLLPSIRALQSLVKSRSSRVREWTDPQDIEQSRELLHRLGQENMTRGILETTRIGNTVVKFQKHPKLALDASRLIQEWKKVAPECTGRAAQARQVYRARLKELQREHKPKPDMVAYKELHDQWTPKLKHGEIDGVPVGVTFEGRGEAAIVGVHTSILSGIDARKEEPCYAVCISGSYKDDETSSRDGKIVYTGCGGQKNKRQVEDQKKNTANRSLLLSFRTQTPIRLLEMTTVSQPPVYIYKGLYKCTEHSYEPSKDGPRVFKFTLEPMTQN